MKKKKKDKDGSNTIVFEIREYRFRTEYDSGYVSALGMVAWFEFTTQWRVVSLLFQLLAPSLPRWTFIRRFVARKHVAGGQ